MEAMSAGLVVVRTDAPPMNEFIVDKRCLVPYYFQIPCRLVNCYFVDPNQLRQVVLNLKSHPYEELKEIGRKNRNCS